MKPLLLTALVALALALPARAGHLAKPRKEYGHGVVRIAGHSPGFWHWRWSLARKREERLERALRRRWAPSLGYGIRLAAAAYGQSAAALRRTAWCESRYQRYTGGSYLSFWQYDWPTWRSSPFAAFSPFDPVASSLATAWYWRRGERERWPNCA